MGKDIDLKKVAIFLAIAILLCCLRVSTPAETQAAKDTAEKEWDMYTCVSLKHKPFGEMSESDMNKLRDCHARGMH